MIVGDPEPADRLYVITDRESASAGLGPVGAVVEAALEAGATFFQLRDKERPPRETCRLGKRLAEHWIDAGAEFLVNGRADLAACLDADGVHRPGDGLPIECLRSVVGERATIGVSTHGREELQAAEEAGADFATLSPVFRSPSKPEHGPALGTDAFERLIRCVDIPVFALGGMTPDRVRQCLEAGAYGVATMSGVMAADAPKAVVREFLEALEGAEAPR